MRVFINFCFKWGPWNYPATTKFEGRWVDIKNNYNIVSMFSDQASIIAKVFLYYFMKLKHWIHFTLLVTCVQSVTMIYFKNISKKSTLKNLIWRTKMFLALKSHNWYWHKRKENLTKRFDKRDCFPFKISRMHFFNSNIPSEIFYSLIGSDALHIARGTSDRLARGTSDRLTFMILVNKL